MTVLTRLDRSGTCLTVRGVADELACATLTVRRRVRAGEIPAVKLGDGRNSAIRIPRAGLDAWLTSHSANPGEEPRDAA
jgi:excisionase family DNA binding protein